MGNTDAAAGPAHGQDPPSTYDTLPCGCVMGTDVVTETFVFIPHALDCEFYVYVQEESARQGKPLITIDAR